MYEEYIIKDKHTLQLIETALMKTYFREYDQDFLTTQHGREDIDANVFNRYNSALQHVVPWVGGQINLKDKIVVEIGCGTGSSTAAFSPFVKKISGYDVDQASVDGAKARLEILERDNADLHVIKAEELADCLKTNHSGGVDVFLLYAVLEHQTIEERHETISQCWDLLNDDGLLVVVETPNLLLYFDHHTTVLPFMHMLPAELYARYSIFSPRDGFNKNFDGYESLSGRELERKISRWGRGVSYHDFHLTIGKDCGKFLVCSGFEPEILTWMDCSPEEELLRLFVETQKVDIPYGFTRAVLNLIFRKNSSLGRLEEKVPENRFFFPIDTVWNQKNEIDHLTGLLKEKEKILNEVFSSNRWRLINILSGPYRKLKSLISG